MPQRVGEYIGRFLERWAAVATRSAVWIVLACLAAGAVAVSYTAGRLGVDTDAGHMLSADLPFRRAYERYKHAFPQLADTLLLVVDGPTPEASGEVSRRLVERIKARPELFRTVHPLEGGPFLEAHALLFLSVGELQTLTDNLARSQPFLATLCRNPGIPGLFDLIVEAMDRAGEAQQVDVDPLLGQIGESLEARLAGGDHRISWQGLMRGREPSAQDAQRMIAVQPRLDFDRLYPAERAITALRALAGTCAAEMGEDVSVRLTGDAAIDQDDMQSVARSAVLTTAATMILVGLTLWAGLRSLSLIVATLTTLAVGLALTAAFATFAIGQLNMISIAFAVLYIGLGVDYAIHLCLRYRELVAHGHSVPRALRGAVHNIGPTLLLCTLSTAIGFYAFIPTTFRGVSELGVIAGTGMFISLIMSLTLLPALLTILPPVRGGARSPLRSPHRLSHAAFNLFTRWRFAIRLSVPVIGLACLLLIPRTVFDANPLNLRNPDSASVATLKDLIASNHLSPWTISVIARGPDRARAVARRLAGLSTVDRAVTIGDYVPDDQAEKEALIEELSLVLGPQPLRPAPSPPHALAEQVAALRRLDEGLRARVDQGPARSGSAVAARVAGAVDAFLEHLAGIDEDQQQATCDALERDLLGSLPVALATLRTSLAATTFTFGDLPAELRDRWVTPEDERRIEVVPREDVSDAGALRAFVGQVTGAVPDATGPSVILLKSADAVVAAFREAFTTALLAVTLLLLVVSQNLRDTVLILLPLLLAGVLTGAATVVLHIPFNFANVIALPLLLGVGVDSGIHIVHRAHRGRDRPEGLLHSSTTRGVVLSALTTLLSFGNLAFNHHRGLASMGQLLSMGILFTMLTTLFVLPAFLFGKPRIRRPAPVSELT